MSPICNHLKDLAAYNRWATTRLVEWLKSHCEIHPDPESLLDADVVSSFPSLRKTLLHIWDVEYGWTGYLTKYSAELTLGAGFSPKVAELFDGVIRQSTELDNLIQSFSAEEMEEYIPFVVPGGMESGSTRAEMLQHIVLHGGYHRGQLVTIGRQVGLTDAPMTDYMFYVVMGRHVAEVA